MSRSSQRYKTLKTPINSSNGEYFRWLIELIGGEYYMFLCDALVKKAFHGYVPNDDDREADGKKLRGEFADEYMYYIPDILEIPCNMLELLIGIAYRLEFMTDESMRYWFWKLLENLGLGDFKDDEYYDAGGPDKVEFVLCRFENRTFKRNGLGGLFPLKMNKQDQRKVEIWAQMNAYLEENYNFL